jgi:hypothetical protein
MRGRALYAASLGALFFAGCGEANGSTSCECSLYQCDIYLYEIGKYMIEETDQCIRGKEGYLLSGECRYCSTCTDLVPDSVIKAGETSAAWTRRSGPGAWGSKRMNSEFEAGGTYALLYDTERKEQAEFAYEALNGARPGGDLEKIPYGFSGFRWKVEVPLWGATVFDAVTARVICQCLTNNDCDEWGYIASIFSFGIAVFFLVVMINNARKQFILYHYVRDYEVSEYPIQTWQKSREWGLYAPCIVMLTFLVVSIFFYLWRDVF